MITARIILGMLLQSEHSMTASCRRHTLTCGLGHVCYRYNNQYMVVDLKRFQPRKQLQEGLLWVVEQLPGLVEAADMTSTLSRGYCECGVGWGHRLSS